MNQYAALARGRALGTRAVLRNTYALLGLSVLVCAVSAWLSTAFYLSSPGFLPTVLVYYALLYAIERHAHEASGIAYLLVLTAFMGYTLAPLLNFLLSSALGASVLVAALLGTGVSFVALSSYVLITEEDFGFLGGFLYLALVGALVASAASLLFALPVLAACVACAMTVVSSALILYHTSALVHGGERNYILATLSLFLAAYNLFINLIQVLMIFSSNRRD